MKITMEETINAPQEQVFEVFADIENAADRISGIKKLEVLSDARSGNGVRWRETRVMMGKEATEEMTITGFTPPDSYLVEAHSHGMHYKTTTTFTAEGGQSTRVTWDFEGIPQTLGTKIFSLISFLFVPMTRKALVGDMRDLKTFIESGKAQA